MSGQKVQERFIDIIDISLIYTLSCKCSEENKLKLLDLDERISMNYVNCGYSISNINPVFINGQCMC